jgi:hypothetical protein
VLKDTDGSFDRAENIARVASSLLTMSTSLQKIVTHRNVWRKCIVVGKVLASDSSLGTDVSCVRSEER